MTITEVRQALGSWELRLRENTPRAILDQLDYFGHIAIIPNKVSPAEYGDNLLAAARYVGVYRSRSSGDDFLLRGSGMAFWLGDEDGKGDVFETAVTLTGATFAASVTALLPPGGAITAGVINSVAGTYTGTHKWQTSRQAQDYVTQLFGAEWRVTNDGKLDAGTIAQLYVTDPRAIILRKDDGLDLKQRALPGRTEMGRDAEDFTTRVVLLAEGEGDQIATGDADIVSNPFNDIHGNDVRMTRLVSESDTTAANADQRAQLLLNLYSDERASVSLSTSTYDIKGDLAVGDYVNVWDPNVGFYDNVREVYWNGQPINPIALRVVEMTWPIPSGWTVAFRRGDGTWIDLSPYYAGESGETTVVVGDLSRSLATSEPIGFRPSLPDSPTLDTTIPDSPAFTAWSFGAYQTPDASTTKAAVHITWSTPLNTDSSVITDGAYYEIRYRVSQVIGYQIMWGAIHNIFRWGQLAANRWGAPLSAAVSADPEWTYIQIGWGTNQTTIIELTPGVIYEFQIRAVDSANPPHFGNFSASSFQTTTGDLFAPSTPAAPTVAGNLLSIQVVHSLGKASGGTFNLEADLVRLNVHVGGSDSFMPSDNNKVGELTANIGMMNASIPAVGTFTISPTETVFVKVVAVDRAGNKSGPSVGSTVTAVLIDNEHVSSLSVSKLTAGTITANSVLAAMIEVGSGGNVTVTNGAFNVKDANGNIIVRMGLLPDGKYGFRVDDASGNPQIRAGELVSGGYGMEAVDETGALVSLSTLAFGTEAAGDFGSVDIPTTGAPLFYAIDPDNLSVRVRIGTSRRAIVFIGAQIFHELDNPPGTYADRSGFIGYRVTDLTTGEMTFSPGNNVAGGDLGGNTGDPDIPYVPGNMHVGNAFLMSGAFIFPTAPGDYLFEVCYINPIGAVGYQNRNIVVLPY